MLHVYENGVRRANNPQPKMDCGIQDTKAAILSQVLDALLPGNRLPWSLTGTGVGSRSLSAYRQALLVPNATIAFDFAKSVNALSDLTSKWTLDGIIAFEQSRQSAQFVFIQVSCLFRRTDFCLDARFPSNNGANAVKILK
jgi:hypothetical protein